MAWTTPITKSSGNVLNAADWNTNTSDNVLFVARPPRGFAVMTSSHSIATGIGAYTTVQINSLQVGSDVTLVSNTLRPQVAGLYEIFGLLTWPYNTTGVRIARIAVNGTTAHYDLRDTVANTASQGTTNYVHTWVTCAVNDQISLGGAQDSGGNLSVQANVYLACRLLAVT